MKAFLISSLALVLSVFSAHAENIKLKTPRGTELDVVVTRPARAQTKSPAILIAPGQGYHMNLPLVQRVADEAAQSGFVAYRFNWSYYTKDPAKGEPSEDLGLEIEDLKSVLAHMKSDDQVDTAKIVLAGKSLGTMVSYPVFRSEESLVGLILMTPICTDPDTGKAVGNEYYPEFSKNQRPIAMVLGNADGLCSLPALYEFAKDSKSNVSINVVGGGHSLIFGAPNDPANADRDARNLAAAVSSVVNWANIMVQPAKASNF